MNYSELQKLYTDFKIPYEKEADYYIGLLLDGDKKLHHSLFSFQEAEVVCKYNNIDISKYKFQKFEEILKYFKDHNWDLNLIDPKSEWLNSGYTSQEFGNYKPDKYYVSVDLVEANWQAFQFAFGLSFPSFEEWSMETFDLLSAFAKSKSFRQFLFGNTNPKRLQKIQEFMMKKLYDEINKYSLEIGTFIVAKRSDELLFECNEYSEVLSCLMCLTFAKTEIKYNFKTSFFKITEHTNFNEFVKIKEVHEDDFQTIIERQLMSVPGNRFFLHYKTLILNQGLDERDLLFRSDKNLAKWVI